MANQIHSKSEGFVPDVSMYSDAYILARAAGALHGEAVRRYLKDFQEANGDLVRQIRLTLGRLRHARVLSEGEVLHMESILKLLKNQTASNAEALKVVRDVYNALVNEEASPCAVALASIAENSVHLAIEMESAERGPNWWRVLGQDLAGAGAGALAGAAAGGVGAPLGAVCGAAIASGRALSE